MKIFLFIIILFLNCQVALSQVKKDTIYFNNGTIVIGKLKKIKMGVVTFDPDEANDITVQLRKVKTIDASHDFYRVETTENKVYYGILKPDSNRTILITNGLTESSIRIEDIFNLYAYSERMIQRFSGNAGIGYSYTKSSGYGRLNLDGALTYNSRKQEVNSTFSGIYTITDSAFTRDREEFSIKDNFYFSPTSFATVFLVYQRNLELGLNRRFQEGLGIGNKFITSRVAYGWARTGFVGNQERNTEGEGSGMLFEYFAQLQFNFFKFTKPEVKFDIKQTFYAGITDKGRVRTDGEVNLTWEMIKDLDLSLKVYDNLDSKPPVPGSSKLDYGIIFGIAYSFN